MKCRAAATYGSNTLQETTPWVATFGIRPSGPSTHRPEFASGDMTSKQKQNETQNVSEGRAMDNQTSGMPDAFDRLLGAIHGLPDIASTKPATVRTVTPVVGTSQLFIVQTYRQREVGDTIFLECVSKDGTVRIAVPPAVSDAIARQREVLTGKSRSKAARAVAAARKERGELPGFMKGKRK